MVMATLITAGTSCIGGDDGKSAGAVVAVASPLVHTILAPKPQCGYDCCKHRPKPDLAMKLAYKKSGVPIEVNTLPVGESIQL